MAAERQGSLSVPGAAAALGWLALLQLIAAWRAGQFEYPLDDVYIHLSMAAGIAQGTYGINPGEPASAASSILYPLLLLPFAGTGIQRLLPALWNTAAVAAAGAIWGLAMSGIRPRRAALGLAVFGPLVLFMSGLGFTGMEHALHMVAAMLAVVGLWRFLTGGGLAWWFVAAVVLAPLIRFEALALSLLAAALVALRGRPAAGLGMALGCVAPVVAFALFLQSQGLAPLPGSVLVKMDEVSASASLPLRIAETLAYNLREPSAVFLLIGLILAAALRAGLGRGKAEARVLLAVVALAALAQLLLGRVGWMNRYETYAMVAVALAIALAWAPAARPGATRPWHSPALVLSLILLAGAPQTLVPTFRSYVNTPDALHNQQAQMARLVHEFLPGPVAVNDIGLVAWNAPAYVLDLWGLASAEARSLRLDPQAPAGWAGPLARRHDARLAMIYESWLERAIAPDWVRLGKLVYYGGPNALGSRVVTFYATSAEDVPQIEAALDQWTPGLPSASAFVPAKAGE